MAPVIQVRDLVKTYHVGEHTVRALRGADMDVQAAWVKNIPGYIAKADANWPKIVAEKKKK